MYAYFLDIRPDVRKIDFIREEFDYRNPRLRHRRKGFIPYPLNHPDINYSHLHKIRKLHGSNISKYYLLRYLGLGKYNFTKPFN